LTDRDADDFADFLIEFGTAAATIGPMLIFLGKLLRTGSISKDDAMSMIFPLLWPILPEFMRWARQQRYI
jgi:hypothetical protein